MTYANIKVEKKGGIVLLTINRPDKLNALTWDCWREISQAVGQLGEDEEARVLVITGSGRGFCSGTDLAAVAAGGGKAPSEGGRSERLRSRYLAATTIIACPKPSIAAINGVAVGGGLALCLACDIRIASQEAHFSAMWSRRALVPDFGASYLLPRIVGMSKALELMYTAQTIDAHEALAIDLVSQVVAAKELMPTAMALAERIAKGPTIAIELTKRLAYQGWRQELECQTEYEEYLQRLCIESEDVQEGIRSFLEKREPIFKGR
jgi:2-(1,2-epoxy-1,2-dihydrophenyl)acetyl-CoA isomerase